MHFTTPCPPSCLPHDRECVGSNVDAGESPTCLTPRLENLRPRRLDTEPVTSLASGSVLLGTICRIGPCGLRSGCAWGASPSRGLFARSRRALKTRPSTLCAPWQASIPPISGGSWSGSRLRWTAWQRQRPMRTCASLRTATVGPTPKTPRSDISESDFANSSITQGTPNPFGCNCSPRPQ